MPAFKYPRTSQPQGAVEVDWSNPITKGLALAVSGAFPGINLVTHLPAHTLNGVKSAPGQDGLGLSFPSTSSTGMRLAQSTVLSGSAGDCTGLTVCILGNPKSTSGRMMGFSISGIGNECYVSFNASGSLSSVPGMFSASQWGAGGTEGIAGAVDGQTHLFTAIYAARSGGTVRPRVYVDKSEATFETAVSNSPSPGSVADYIGGYRVDGFAATDFQQFLTLGFNVEISDAVRSSLVDNPWQLFKPVSRSLWIPGTVSGGGAATVIPIGQQATGSVGTLVATGAAKALPAGVSASSAVGTPVAVGGSSIPATATPSGVSATGSVGTVTATGQAKASPSGVSATASAGSPVALAGGAAVATPAGVQAVGAVGNLIATGAAWVVPGGVSASGAVGTPVASGGAAVAAVAYPAGLVGYWSVGTPTINTTGIDTVSGAATRPSRLQVSNRAHRYQTGTRHAR